MYINTLYINSRTIYEMNEYKLISPITRYTENYILCIKVVTFNYIEFNFG